jgi:hypothetical protein
MQQSHTPTTPFGRRSLMLARVASGIAASTRPPEKLPRNKRFAGNGAGAETEVAFEFDPPPLVARPEKFEIQSLSASHRNDTTNFFATPYLFAPCGAYSCGRPDAEENHRPAT